MLKHFFTAISFLFLFFIIVVTSTAYGQSVVWDEKTKSWVSTATPTPTQTPQPQQPQTTTVPTAPSPATVIQTVPTTAPGSAVDLGTLATVLTPILGAIAGIFIKNKKDMEKNDEKTKEETIKAIEQAIIPKLKQITPVAEQTAKQDVKINQIAEELYKVMAEKANDIHDKPEIQQQKLIEDMVRSRMVADQTKQSSGTGSMVWDDTRKEWVSK